MKLAPTVLLLAAVAAPTLAQTPPAIPPATVSTTEGQRLAMTIYNDDLALVQDVRPLSLPPGRARVEFRDVSAAIRPETVSLTGRGIGIVEQNFDFDLLTPAKMMEKAVGREVKIVRTNPGDGREVTETATVLSAVNGVVLRIGDRIEVLRDDGTPTRVIFDRVPENLRARPTLTVSVAADGVAQREATLTYLTGGLGWKADYVALFDERAGRTDVQGWVTLTNRSGTGYRDAALQLVAGSVGGGGGYQPVRRPTPRGIPGVRSGGTEAGGAEALADFYIYPLKERTTVEQNQTKQVGLLNLQGVAAARVYEYRTDDFQTLEEPVNVASVLRFSNSAAGGGQAALPAGTVRVYQRDAAGDPKFIGESAIGHTPAGSELALKTGDAFDITVQPTREALERAPGGVVDRLTRSRVRMRYVVRNAKPTPVTVSLRQGGLWRDGKVIVESAKSTRVDSSTLGWELSVPANGETTLTFTVETGW